MLRHFFVAACLIACCTAASPVQAQLRIPGLGRPERPERSVLEEVRAGMYASRCDAPVENVTDEQVEAYDLVDQLSTAPRAVRYNANLVPAQGMYAVLNQILGNLVAVQAPPAGITASVVVDDTGEVDARQVGAGQIIITRGLIEAVQARGADVPREQITYDLAFVLAHEYAHVLLCHYNRSVQVSRNRSTLRNLSSIGLIAVSLANSNVTRTGTNINVNTDQQAAGEDYFKVMAGLTLLRTVNSSIVNPSWGRQQERDADWLAVELMMTAGYDPNNVGDLLGVLHQRDERFAQERQQLMAAVPQQALGAFMLSLNDGGNQTNTRNALLGIGLNTGIQMFDRWRTSRLRHFHDEPDKRTTTLTSMIQFRLGNGSPADVASFAQFAEGATPAPNPAAQQLGDRFLTTANTELTATQQVRAANTAFAQNDVDAACAAATQARTTAPTAPGPLMASGLCEVRRNNIPAAARHYDAALRSPLATPDNFQDVAYVWRGANQRPRAEAALTAGARRFGARDFYEARMQMAAYYQELPGVQAVAAECAAATEPPEVKTRCADEANQLTQQLTAAQQPQQQQTNQTPAIPNAGSILRGLVPGQRN